MLFRNNIAIDCTVEYNEIVIRNAKCFQKVIMRPNSYLDFRRTDELAVTLSK